MRTVGSQSATAESIFWPRCTKQARFEPPQTK
jgi:hypothetical protein